jgi:hypothetical protein
MCQGQIWGTFVLEGAQNMRDSLTAKVPSLRRLFKNFKRRIELKRDLKNADIVVISIKKSGRTWLRAMLTRLFHNVYGTPTNLLLDADNHKRLNTAAPTIVFAHDSDPISSAKDVMVDLSIYDGVKIVLLVRNPADTVVSLYHHYLNRKSGRRQKLASALSIFEFVSKPEHGIHTIISFLNHWGRYAKTHNNVTVFKYEDFHANTIDELARFARLTGTAATPDQILDAVEFASFENLRKLEAAGYFDDVSLRKTDTKNPEGLKVRRGKVNGYKSYFSTEEAVEIERMIEAELDPWYGYHSLSGEGSERDSIPRSLD